MTKKEKSPTEEEMSVDTPVSPDKEQKKQAKAQAKAFLRAACADAKMDEVEQVWPDVAKALRILYASSRTSTKRRRAGGPLWNAVVNFIMEHEGSVDEQTLWQQFRMGRTEVRQQLRAALKNMPPETRVWAVFDEKAERWNVVGTGADVPAAYTGYVPAA